MKHFSGERRKIDYVSGEITICGMTGASLVKRWGETERFLAPTLKVDLFSSDILFSSMIRLAMTTIKREKRDGIDATAENTGKAI